MTEAESAEWIQLSFGYDHSSVKAEAEAELVKLGLSSKELTGTDLRMDVGTDISKNRYFKVSLRRSVLQP